MHFKANPFLSLIAFLVLILFISLALWQIDRANEKQGLIDLQNLRMQQQPVALSTVVMNNKQRYLPVYVYGELDHKQQILISNQVRNRQLGYYVLTPIKSKAGINVLVNRGWISATGSLQDLPDIEIAKQSVKLIGKLDTFPSVGITLEGADIPSKGWPTVVQAANTRILAKRLGYELAPYQLLLESGNIKTYDTEWVAFQMGPERHLGYAFQWFAMALALIIIYLVLSISIRKKTE
jgi:surfeit locus 1 family protein